MKIFPTFQDALDSIAADMRDEKQRRGLRFFDPQGNRIPWIGTGRGADPAWTHLGICPVAALTGDHYDEAKAKAIKVGQPPFVLIVTRYPPGALKNDLPPCHTVVARWERKSHTAHRKGTP